MLLIRSSTQTAKRSWLSAQSLLLALLHLAAPASVKADDLLSLLIGRREPPRRLQVIRARPITFVTDGPLPEAAAIRDELLALGDRLHEELGVPRLSVPVRIYVFGTREAYARYLVHEVPDANFSWQDTLHQGMFLRRNGRPYLFCYRGEGFRTQLRHEFTHAVLNDSHHMPVWLDEGLAQYYEQGAGAVLTRHVETLGAHLRRGWRPDLSALERLTRMQDLGPDEYAEAWSWVHLLLAGRPETRELIGRYLAQLRDERAPRPISEALVQHLGPAERAWQMHFRSWLAARGAPAGHARASQ